MTSTVTSVTMTIIKHHSYAWLSMHGGVIAILLLLGLLIEGEFLRAVGTPRLVAGRAVLATVIVPLLLPFTLIIGVRFLILLHLA